MDDPHLRFRIGLDVPLRRPHGMDSRHLHVNREIFRAALPEALKEF